jgi:hypothetical protein
MSAPKTNDYARADVDTTLRVAEQLASQSTEDDIEAPPKILLTVVLFIVGTLGTVISLAWWFSR